MTLQSMAVSPALYNVVGCLDLIRIGLSKSPLRYGKYCPGILRPAREKWVDKMSGIGEARQRARKERQ
jgi:hypothetical protein